MIPRVLVTTNRQVPENLVEYSHHLGQFINLPAPGNMVVAYHRRGTYIHLLTDDARDQLISQGIDRMYLQYFSTAITSQLQYSGNF